MQLKDRVTIISEDNYDKLTRLYGKLNIDELEDIVNRHMTIIIDEIMEDIEMENKVPCCKECEYVTCVEQVYKNYYCDNEDRVDDMGKLGKDCLPETSPEWCPKKTE